MGKHGLKDLIVTLTDMKCQATANGKCRTIHTDVVALSVALLVIGTGGKSLIVCVGGLELSRRSSVWVV